MLLQCQTTAPLEVKVDTLIKPMKPEHRKDAGQDQGRDRRGLIHMCWNPNAKLGKGHAPGQQKCNFLHLKEDCMSRAPVQSTDMASFHNKVLATVDRHYGLRRNFGKKKL